MIDDSETLNARLGDLTEEHRDLDAAIEALASQGPIDQLRIQRLKKRKLCLKDEMKRIEDQLIPDIIV